jgi:hypothetical protein
MAARLAGMGMPKMKANAPSWFWGTDVQTQQENQFNG